MAEPCKDCKKQRANYKLSQSFLSEEQNSNILKIVHVLDTLEPDIQMGITYLSFKDIEEQISKEDINTLKKEKEYLYAIGLIWFYQIWAIDKNNFRPSAAYSTIKRWDEKNSDMWVRILKWWVANADDIKDLLVNYITFTLKGKTNG